MKVGVVGSRAGGQHGRYAMVMSGVGREIVMVDVSRERAQAQADDISHAVPFAHPSTSMRAITRAWRAAAQSSLRPA